MNIKVFQNRKVSKDYFDNEGTQNENYSTTLSFEFPLGYEDFSKRIVFITEDGNFWDYIKDNEYVIKNNITKYENVEAYLWLTKDNQDFRSETFELNFYENQNPDNMTPSEEQLDGYNTLIAELELKVEEVDALKEETLEALEKLKEQQIDYENRFEEINDMLKELKDTNEYQSEIIDQFKNEFDEKEFEGASAHLPDSAELPLKLQPQGNIEQVVVEEIPGTTVSGELINITDGDSTKEVKAVIDGNSYQDTREGYNLAEKITTYHISSNGSATYEKIKDYVKVIMPETPSITSGIYIDTMRPISADNLGEKAYYSFYAKADSERKIQIKPLGENKYYTITLTTSWQRFSFPIESVVEQAPVFYCSNSLSTVPYYIKDIMFELGETLHDYEQYGSKPSIDFPSDIEVIDMVNRLKLVPQLKYFSGGIVIGNTPSGIINAYDNNNINFTTTNPNYIGVITEPISLKSGEILKVTGNVNGSTSLRAGSMKLNEDGTYTKINNSVATTSSIEYSYTATEDITIVVGFWTNGDITYTIDLTNLMATTKANAPFLPYGYIGLLQRNKNIWKPTLFNEGIKIEQANSTVELDGDEYIFTAKNNDIYLGTAIEKGQPYNKWSGTLYAVGDKKKIVFNVTNPEFSKHVLNTYDENKISLGYSMYTAGTVKTLPDNVKYFSIRFGKGNAVAGTVYKTKIQLEYDVATEYETPKQNLIPINLNGNTLAKVGEIKDLLNIGLDGSASITQNNKLDIFDGSADENWTFDKNNNRAYVGITRTNANRTNSKCNMFKEGNTETNGNCFNVGTSSAFFRNDELISSSDDMRALLQEKPLQLLYSIEKAETIQLPSIKPIKLFEGTNNFELVTNLDTTINMTYNHVGYSPSIVKPSEVKGVSGHYDTVVENRNRFNINAEPFFNTGASKTVINNGIRVTATLNGTWLGTLYNLGEITRYKGKTIRVKAISKASANNTPFIGLGLCDKNGNNRKSLVSNNKIGKMAVSLLLNPTENQTHAYISINATGEGTCNTGDYIDYTDIIVTIDDTNTDYIEHQEQLLPIDIPFNMYSGKPYKENGKWYRPIEYKKEYLSGKLIGRTATNTNGKYRFGFDLDNAYRADNATEKYLGYCNLLKQGTRDNTYSLIPCICNAPATSNSYGTGGVFYMEETSQMTTQQANEYITEKGMYVVYPLATPTVEEITDTTLIEQLENIQRAFSYYPVTNVNSYKPTVNVADLILNGKYYVSNKAKFKTLEERVSALENETVNE